MKIICSVMAYLGLVLLIWPAHPVYRLGMLVFLGAIIWLRPHTDRQLKQFSDSLKWRRAILGIVLIVLAIRGVLIAKRLFGPIEFIEDVAVANAEAIKAIFLNGENPYVKAIDLAHPPYFGLKYPPLQLLTYAPFVLLGGYRGIYYANLIIFIGIAGLLFRWSARRSMLHGWLALGLLALNDPFATMCFNNGTNDFLPVLLTMIAVRSIQHAGAVQTTGGWLGLSTLSKQLPSGLVVWPLLVEQRWRPVFWAGAVFLLGSLPFLILSPVGYFENLVLANFMNPAQASSVQYYLPGPLRPVLQVLGLLVWGALSILGRSGKNAWSLGAGFGNLAVGMTVFLLSTKMSQMQYWVWVAPFWILWILSAGEHGARPSS